MVIPKRQVHLKAQVKHDDDIDSYLEAQLVADIKAAKTREVKVVRSHSSSAKVDSSRKYPPSYESYDSVIIDDFKLPNN